MEEQKTSKVWKSKTPVSTEQTYTYQSDVSKDMIKINNLLLPTYNIKQTAKILINGVNNLTDQFIYDINDDVFCQTKAAQIYETKKYFVFRVTDKYKRQMLLEIPIELYLTKEAI
jgi:hypothetical protein